MGSYNHEPNVDAVKILCEKIYPHIKDKVEINLIGAFGEKIDLKNENINILGKIHDLDNVLQYMDIAVSPLRFGRVPKGNY